MKIKTDNFRNKAKILNPSFPFVLCSKHFEKYNKKNGSHTSEAVLFCLRLEEKGICFRQLEIFLSNLLLLVIIRNDLINQYRELKCVTCDQDYKISLRTLP